MIFMVSEV